MYLFNLYLIDDYGTIMNMYLCLWIHENIIACYWDGLWIHENIIACGWDGSSRIGLGRDSREVVWRLRFALQNK
jgi:hypothetical protein